MPVTRFKLIASGVFVCGYLTFQVVYPALAWFRPGFDRFTWHMYAGRAEHPRFTVVFDDGRTRDLGLLLRRNSPIRLLGPSVDQARVVPSFLCGRWPGVRDVRMDYTRAGESVVVACRELHR